MPGIDYKKILQVEYGIEAGGVARQQQQQQQEQQQGIGELEMIAQQEGGEQIIIGPPGRSYALNFPKANYQQQ